MVNVKIIGVAYLITVLLFGLILRNVKLKNRKLQTSIFMLLTKNALKCKRDSLLAKNVVITISQLCKWPSEPNAIIDGEFISQCG
jgi:hypothetical protein